MEDLSKSFEVERLEYLSKSFEEERLVEALGEITTILPLGDIFMLEPLLDVFLPDACLGEVEREDFGEGFGERVIFGERGEMVTLAVFVGGRREKCVFGAIVEMVIVEGLSGDVVMEKFFVEERGGSFGKKDIFEPFGVKVMVEPFGDNVILVEPFGDPCLVKPPGDKVMVDPFDVKLMFEEPRGEVFAEELGGDVLVE